MRRIPLPGGMEKSELGNLRFGEEVPQAEVSESLDVVPEGKGRDFSRCQRVKG
jgi:hypothetical protein